MNHSIQEELVKILKEVLSTEEVGEVMISDNPEHGDYSANAPLVMAKGLKKSPLKLAKEMVTKIKKRTDWRIEKTEAVAPGFVNFFLTKDYLREELLSIIKEGEHYGASSEGEGKTVIIDYSSPNIAKSFGIGHLRSTIIGQAIYNIYNFLGWRCIGDNHLGDWGTQFGKLIYQIKTKGREDDVQNLKIKELEELYVSFHKEAEGDKELEEKGRSWFQKLESGDKEAKEIWEACVETSVKEFSRIYKLLDVKIDLMLGESFYVERAQEIIEEMKAKKIVTESQGALIVKFNDEKLPPIILVKSDGTTTYLARDLAAIKYRMEKWSPDLFIYEVGSDQSLYFKQLFEIGRLLEWDKKTKFVHIAHGLVRWPHGKFSTRRGETIHLEEVLNETIRRALEIGKQSENKTELSREERMIVAEMVGIGAVKYNDLSQHHSRDIIFDWEKMLNLKGNSGPYLQYTLARANSVLEKSSGFNEGEVKTEELNKEEELFLRKIRLFPQRVAEAGQTFSPNIICNFLFEIAQSYNLFYNQHKIIGSENEGLRVAMTLATIQVLKNGLKLLGILTPKRM